MTPKDHFEENLKRILQGTRPSKTLDAVGSRCAADGCGETKNISYEKPLCFRHWKKFQDWQLWECERCHWFDDPLVPEELLHEYSLEEDLCFDCFNRQNRKEPLAPIYAHGPVEKTWMYLYILKMNNGMWYVGQTNDLALRLEEHNDGETPSTRGKEPKLVWFERWDGTWEDLKDEEDNLTLLATKYPRQIRRMVEQWQTLYRLVDWEA